MKRIMSLLKKIPTNCPACGAEVSSFAGRRDATGMAKVLDVTPMPQAVHEYDCGARIKANELWDDVDGPHRISIFVEDGCKKVTINALEEKAKVT